MQVMVGFWFKCTYRAKSIFIYKSFTVDRAQIKLKHFLMFNFFATTTKKKQNKTKN